MPRIVIPAGTGSDRVAASVCTRFACRQRVLTLPHLLMCPDCDRPLEGFAARAAGRCGTTACAGLKAGRLRAGQRAAEAVALHARLLETAVRLRDGEPWGHSAADADAPVVLVPSTSEWAFPMRIPPRTPPPVRVPRRRVRALRAHLRQIAAEAVALPGTATPAEPPGEASTESREGVQIEIRVRRAPRVQLPPPSTDESALLGAACATCGGRCCRLGAEHAYLTAEIVQRWIAEHPDDGARGAVAAYTRYVPETSIQGSCVYHTTTGCALPRAMRSDTCNRFLCEGLKGLRQHFAERVAEGRPVRRAFLAVIEDLEVARGAWATAG